MPFVFLILGLLFIIVAIRGTQGEAFNLLKSEFTGTGNFIIFVSAIAILGAVGYVPPLKKPADALILLVLLAMVLGNKGGVFAQFNNALRNPIAPTNSGAGAPVLTSPGTVVPSLAPSSFGAPVHPPSSEPTTSWFLSWMTGRPYVPNPATGN